MFAIAFLMLTAFCQSNVSMNPLIYHFVAELVVDLLHWRWVLLIGNTYKGIDPLLIESLFQRNVSVMRLTSVSKIMLHNIIQVHGNIPIIVISPHEVPAGSFIDSCRIKWVLLLSDNSSVDAFPAQTFQAMQKLHLLFVQSTENGSFDMKVPNMNSNVPETINIWSPNAGFKTSTSFQSCTTGPLKHLHIVMEKHFPFYKPSNGSIQARGSDIRLLDSLATALSFTYEIIRSPDRSWGGRNGTEWIGMIGMLVKDEADAALSGMTITYDRYTAVRFSIPYAFDRITYVTRKPTKKPKTWAIFWPYTMQVWISIGLSFFMVSLLMTLLRNAFKHPKRRKARFTDTALFIFQALLAQGHYNACEIRCRVLMTFWWGFCITMVAGYNGSLMSFMAHPGFNPSLDTVPQLVAAILKNNFAVGTIKNSADYTLFKNSDEADLRRILESMESDPRNLVRHDVDGLRECLARDYAYVGGELTVRADIWDTRLFLFAQDSFLQYGYAIAFNPSFCHIDQFNKKIRQLQEAGIIRKWMENIIEKQQTSEIVRTDESQENTGMMHVLRIDDVQGAFSVLCIGLTFACLSCLVEYQIYIYRYKMKRKNRKRR